MNLKIKVKPEDFIVNEITNLRILAQGRFCVYKLRKSGWNTVDVLKTIAKKHGISLRDISYGGKKDRHGLTSQYITIMGERKTDIKEKNYSLDFEGYSDRPMGPDAISGNKFIITVRKLLKKESDKAYREAELITRYGVPNYFDDQRFGSYDKTRGFFAEKALKKQYNGALKAYLTSVYSEDSKEEKKRKNYLFEYWKRWELCALRARTEFERNAYKKLFDKSSNYYSILSEISLEELSLFIAAYQSFLWNEMERLLLQSLVSGILIKYPGKAGDYLFYKKLCKDEYKRLMECVMPVPGVKAVFRDKLARDIYDKVLVDNDIRPSMFNNFRLRHRYFRSFARKAVIIPKDLSCNIHDDEVYENKKKMIISCTLDRGCYMTIIIKRIFCV